MVRVFFGCQVASDKKKIESQKQVDSGGTGAPSLSEKPTTGNLLKGGGACSKDINIHRVGDTVMLDFSKDDSEESGCDAALVDTSGQDAEKVCFSILEILKKTVSLRIKVWNDGVLEVLQKC